MTDLPTRRRPRQARSRATVDAIVEAAAQVLERGGPEAFSTNAVAERAGVSIGTLYQYFASKDELLLAAARRELDAPLADRARALMAALIETIGRLASGANAGAPSPHRTGPARSRPRVGGTLTERTLADVRWLVGPALRPI